jgi:nucleotide sugar dehydrogenase
MRQIGVIGVGRLGICTALILEEAGFDVVCYDVNKSICESITRRQIVTSEKGVAAMLEKAKNIRAVDTLEGVLGLDVLFCIVATPSLPDGSYDHKYVNSVVDELIQKIPKDQSSRILFNICCTTMPGYSDTVQKRFDEAKVPVDVCYNPEFIAQGDVLHGFTHPDTLLIGEANVAAGDTLVTIYNTFVKTTPAVCRMTRKEAEITKISINCFITTKISFANTIGDLCVHEGLNADRVLKAIGSDSRIGRKYLNWGHGYGGPCFPRDNRALCFYSAGQTVRNRIGEATDETNASHLQFIVETLTALAKQTGKQFLFRDLAYKPETNILEESQTFALAKALDLRGFPIYVQESSEMQNELQTQSKGQFLFVDSSIDISEYILVDAKLSCIRDSFE